MSNQEIQKFTKLSKQQKNQLTLGWLVDLIKTNHLTLHDVMDIINSCDQTFSNIDKFNSMIDNNHVNASTISRLFGYGYAKSMKIINLLLEEKAIIKQNNGYSIVDKEKFKQIGEQLFNKGENNE
ncbi:MAG: hypothetical protein IJ371_02750 [Clostridia bacterium]|nr:hypothetical protein [Clostridia bacterium]